MPQTFSLQTLGSLIILVALSTGLAAQMIPDRFQKNHDIHVETGEIIGDATCINCSIYIRGQLAGDATAIKGNVVVEQGAKIAGDVTVLFGKATIENQGQVGGDATAIGDGPPRSRGARGRRRYLPGGGWMGAVHFPRATGSNGRDHRFDRLAGAAAAKTSAGGRLRRCRKLRLRVEDR